MITMTSFDFGFAYRLNFKTKAQGFSEVVRLAGKKPY
jgi:hypothetical protein